MAGANEVGPLRDTVGISLSYLHSTASVSRACRLLMGRADPGEGETGDVRMQHSLKRIYGLPSGLKAQQGVVS